MDRRTQIRQVHRNRRERQFFIRKARFSSLPKSRQQGIPPGQLRQLLLLCPWERGRQGGHGAGPGPDRPRPSAQIQHTSAHLRTIRFCRYHASSIGDKAPSVRRSQCVESRLRQLLTSCQPHIIRDLFVVACTEHEICRLPQTLHAVCSCEVARRDIFVEVPEGGTEFPPCTEKPVRWLASRKAKSSRSRPKTPHDRGKCLLHTVFIGAR